MAWHHHLKTAHEFTKHHTRSFLMAAASSHPILTTLAAVVGVGVVAHSVGIGSSLGHAGSPSSTTKIPPAGVTS